MNFATLRRRARNNTLEVEHLLGLAAARPDGLAGELERLITECRWTDGGEISPGVREIPFRRWARTSIAYARDGHDGLVRLVAADPEYHNFVHGLLEEIPDQAAIDTLLRIDADAALAHPAAHLDRANRLARTLARFHHAKPPVAIAPEAAATLRDFLHRYIPQCQTPVQRANAISALSAVGDAVTLDFLAAQPPLEYPWTDALKLAQRAIRKRLANPPAPELPAPKANANTSAPAKRPAKRPDARSAKLVIYDKAKWHADADDFPAALPPLPPLTPEAAATHIAHYLRWCAENDHLSDELCETHPRKLAALRAGALDARDFLETELDGVLDSHALNAAGRAFAAAYYGEDDTPFAQKHGTYLDDYETHARQARAASTYHYPNTVAAYRRLKPLLDRRHREYLAMQNPSKT